MTQHPPNSFLFLSFFIDVRFSIIDNVMIRYVQKADEVKAVNREGAAEMDASEGDSASDAAASIVGENDELFSDAEPEERSDDAITSGGISDDEEDYHERQGIQRSQLSPNERERLLATARIEARLWAALGNEDDERDYGDYRFQRENSGPGERGPCGPVKMHAGSAASMLLEGIAVVLRPHQCAPGPCCVYADVRSILMTSLRSKARRSF